MPLKVDFSGILSRHTLMLLIGIIMCKPKGIIINFLTKKGKGIYMTDTLLPFVRLYRLNEHLINETFIITKRMTIALKKGITHEI